MNIEENKLPEEGEVDTEIKETEKKKLPLGALIGIIAGAVALVVAIVLLIVLLPGDKCEGHVDADDDYLCDKCGEHYDDGDEAPENPEPEANATEVTFTVVLDSGEPLAGVKFTLERGGKVYDFTTGSDGTVKASIALNTYYISFDLDTIPEYCMPDAPAGVKIDENTSDVSFTVINNTPDGTEKKPFFISENETDVTLAPGQEIFFNYRGSSMKTVTIRVAGISVSYNGEIYGSVGDLLEVPLYPEIGVMTLFSIKNETDSEITTVMELIAKIGSSENPIEITESNTVVSVLPEEVIYYEWTADKAGVVVLTSSAVNGSITVTRILENDVPVISQINGGGAAYITVSEGETITINVSLLDSEELEAEKTVDIDLLISIYEGDEAEPVPVLGSQISISLDAGVKVALKSEAGKSLSISDEGAVCVYDGDDVYTNENGNEISFELSSAIVFVENKSDSTNDIVISFN